MPASGYGHTRLRKNSAYDFGEGTGDGRLIPDYQYRNKAYVASQSAPGQSTDTENAKDHTHSKGTNEESATDNGEERTTDRKRISSKGHAHRKSSRAVREEERKKRSSKTGPSHEKTSRAHSKSSGSQRESKAREANSERAEVRHATSPTTSGADSKSESKAAGETAAQNSSSSRSKSKRTVELTPSSTVTTTTALPPSTTTTKPDELPPPPPPTMTSTSIALLTLEDGTDDVSGGSVSQRVSRDVAWDGRRRYANVWDTLSTPKHTSNVRSVRSRLQREFSNVQQSDTTTTSSKAGPRRPSKNIHVD